MESIYISAAHERNRKGKKRRDFDHRNIQRREKKKRCMVSTEIEEERERNFLWRRGKKIITTFPNF